MWQGAGCQQHRGGAETGLAGLPDVGCSHAILRPKRHTQRRMKRETDRNRQMQRYRDRKHGHRDGYRYGKRYRHKDRD